MDLGGAMLGFRLLGELSVHMAGRPVAVGPARQRLVLAVLAIDANQIVSVDQLVERVWGEEPPQRARATLGVYISRLRHALGSETVRWRSGGYCLAVDRQAVDVHRFHDMCDQARTTSDDTQAAALFTEALQLWGGPALTGLDNHWASAERDRLDLHRLAAEHDFTDARLRAGHGENLVAELSARSGEHPLDERVAGQYMLALYRAGRAADSLRHYRQIRSRLGEELGTDPGPGLQELHQRILQADPSLIGQNRPPTVTREKSAMRAGSAGASAMHSLRGDIAAFTGRDEETERLLDAVGAGDVQAIAIHTVDGMAGVGKTAFAVHVAHRLAPRFPDGQLFVELHGHTPGLRPVPADEALASLLLATGLPGAALPTSVEDRARLWRHRVAGKRVLVVLDDAADHDQVRPLLPGSAGSLVLITSRHRLSALDAVVPLTLPVLPADQATLLLHRLARIGPDRHDPDAAAAVTQLCGQLPLAIALAAAHLRNHPTWTVRQLADQLAATGSRLDTLTAGDRSVTLALNMSFTALPAHQQRLLRLLGAHPGPEVDVFAVAALQDTDMAQARQGLEGLHANHLVEETAPGRFQMHDLVRAYAQHRANDLDPQERAEAVARALRYYLHTTITATDSLQSYRPVPVAAPATPPWHSPALLDYAAARAWLSQELPTLSACVEHAARNGHEAIAIELAASLHPFLRLGDWRRALAIHETALRTAVRLDNRLARANSHYLLGSVSRMVCEFDTAAKHLTDAFNLYQALDDGNGQAYTLHEQAVVRCMQGAYPGAVPLLTEARDLFQALDNDAARANTTKDLGFCHHYVGHFDLATSMITEAQQIFGSLGDPIQEADALRMLARVLQQRGDFQDAYDTATQALELTGESGSLLIMAFARHEVGLAQRDLGDHAAAMASLTRAEKEYTTVGFRPGAAHTRALIGTVHHALGHHETATRLMTEGLTEQRHLGIREDEVQTLIEFGALAFDHPDAGDPQNFYRQALDGARDLGLVVWEARALTGLGRCLHRADDPEAMTYLRQALDIYDPLGLPEAVPVAELVKEAG